MDIKTQMELDDEADAATRRLSTLVRELLDEDMEPSSLTEALAAALGVVLAAAPRHMAAKLDASILAKIQEQRAATWAEIDAAATVQ